MTPFVTTSTLEIQGGGLSSLFGTWKWLNKKIPFQADQFEDLIDKYKSSPFFDQQLDQHDLKYR